MRIGKLALTGRALLAPMAGVTDAGMRRAAAAARRVAHLLRNGRLAPACWKATRNAARAPSGSRARPSPCNSSAAIPPAMAEAARRLAAEGAELIDINMGCPARRVAGALAGSALMRDLDAASRILEAVVEALRRSRHAEDAARLGRRQPQRRRARRARRERRRADGHRPRAHALPVLPGRGGLAGGARGRRGGRAFPSSSTAIAAASRTRGRCWPPRAPRR